MSKKNKVYCVNMARDKPSRLKIIGKWCLALAGLPMTYLVLPVCCCVRNPAAMVLFDDVEPDERMHPAQENLAVGLFGMMSCFCCCGCFCGECATKEPKDW